MDAVFLNAEPPAEEYLVTFTDNGNSEVVTMDDLAACGDEISIGDRLLLDVNNVTVSSDLRIIGSY